MEGAALPRDNALIKNMCNAGACVLTYWWATTVTHKLPGVYVTDGLGDRLNEAAIVKICTILGVLMTVCMRGRTKHSKKSTSRPRMVVLSCFLNSTSVESTNYFSRFE